MLLHNTVYTLIIHWPFQEMGGLNSTYRPGRRCLKSAITYMHSCPLEDGCRWRSAGPNSAVRMGGKRLKCKLIQQTGIKNNKHTAVDWQNCSRNGHVSTINDKTRHYPWNVPLNKTCQLSRSWSSSISHLSPFFLKYNTTFPPISSPFQYVLLTVCFFPSYCSLHRGLA
jgi:hypothetical protein